MLTLKALQKRVVIILTLKEQKQPLTPCGSLDQVWKPLFYILNYLHKQAYLVSNCHTGPTQPFFFFLEAPCASCGCQNTCVTVCERLSVCIVLSVAHADSPGWGVTLERLVALPGKHVLKLRVHSWHLRVGAWLDETMHDFITAVMMNCGWAVNGTHMAEIWGLWEGSPIPTLSFLWSHRVSECSWDTERARSRNRACTQKAACPSGVKKRLRAVSFSSGSGR